MTLRTKAEIEKITDDDFIAVASTEVEDRHGEVVEVQGWDLKNFQANPVLLWGHNHMAPAIGKATKIWVEKSQNPKLMFKGFISEATQLGREVKQLMKEGVLNSFSVGFRPLDTDENRFTKQELLEISVVNVPANADAQMLAYKTLKGAGFDNQAIEECGVPATFIERMDEMENKIKTLTAKEGNSSAPKVDRDVTIDRLTLLKQMSKRIDEDLSNSNKPAESLVTTHKLLKKSVDRLIGEHKKEL